MLSTTKKTGRNIQNPYFKSMKKLLILIITLFFFNSSINAALKEAGPRVGSAFVGAGSEKARLIKLTLHELYHTQGQGFECVPGVKNGHYINKDKPTHLGWGLMAGPAYMHEEKGCPQTADSVYLTPTSKNSYDPYKVMCLKEYGNFNHPKILKALKKFKKKLAEGAPAHELGGVGTACKWTMASRDRSAFPTKSSAVSDFERLR
jgi:hypothetical protein